MRYITLVLVLFTLSVSAQVNENSRKPYKGVDSDIVVPLRFDRYYDYAEVNEALSLLAETYPSLCKVESVGFSDENREILALVINNPKTGDDQSKPGVWVDGNIHGNEVQAGEVCLYYADYLLRSYGVNDDITKTVDRNAHYIVPVVNVDGRYHWFNEAHTPSSSRTVSVAYDDDNDGLFDEDPNEDLDGDGSITMMRIKDPFGNYKVDPIDPRIMVRVAPGEKGDYSLLGYEGIDNDEDGLFNEDQTGYLDPNRNYPGSWQPTYIQGGAGEYPLSSKAIRSVADYNYKHENIIVSWHFHNSGGMFLYSPSAKNEVMISEDAATFKTMAREMEKIVPEYRSFPALDLYPTYGGSIDFAFRINGTFGYVGELFNSKFETFKPADGKTTLTSEQQRLKFNDHVVHGDLFKMWTKYDHPTYGEIEIGGWKKISSRLPHPFMLMDLVHRNSSAIYLTAAQTPDIKLEVLKSEKIGSTTKRVTVRVSNSGLLPSMSTTAFKDGIYAKDYLKLTGAKVIAGGVLSNQYTNDVKFKDHKPEIQFISVPGQGKVDLQFIVEGNGSIKLEFVSRKATNRVIDYSL